MKIGKHNPKWKEWLELKNTRKRRVAKKMLVEGTRLLEELLVSPCEIECLVFSPESLDERSSKIVQSFTGCKYEADTQSLQRLSETETCPGCLAICGQPDWSQLSLRDLKAILILEELSDPGNIGTLVRTARAAGIEAVICNGGADPYSGKTVRASAGAMFYLPVLENQNVEPFAEWGFTVVETAVHGGIDLYDLPISEKTAWVLGNESRGVEKLNNQALRVTIPMAQNCESLNVATAGAILMYEWRRRRG